MTVISFDYAVSFSDGKKSEVPSFTYAELARGAAEILEFLRDMQHYVDVVKIRIPRWSRDFGKIEVDIEIIFSRIGGDKTKKIAVQHKFFIDLPWLEWCSSSCKVGPLMVSEMRPHIVQAMQKEVREQDESQARFQKRVQFLLEQNV